jgi:hypothetical protein
MFFKQARKTSLILSLSEDLGSSVFQIGEVSKDFPVAPKTLAVPKDIVFLVYTWPRLIL